MTHMYLTPDRLPALGDVRACGAGERLWVSPKMRQRDDWSRYVEAISAAVSRGASLRWTVGDD